MKSLATMFQDKTREVALATALLIGATGIYNSNANASEPIQVPGQQTQTIPASHSKPVHLGTGQVRAFDFSKEAVQSVEHVAIGDSMPEAIGSPTHSHFSLLISKDLLREVVPIVKEWAAQYQKDVSIVVGPYTESHIEVFADGTDLDRSVNMNARDFRDELRTQLILLNEVVYGDRLAASGPEHSL